MPAGDQLLEGEGWRPQGQGERGPLRAAVWTRPKGCVGAARGRSRPALETAALLRGLGRQLDPGRGWSRLPSLRGRPPRPRALGGRALPSGGHGAGAGGPEPASPAARPCPSPVAPPNGRIAPVQAEYVLEDRVAVSCDPGYELLRVSGGFWAGAEQRGRPRVFIPGLGP